MVSYAELEARANRLAHHLVSRGVRPGARTAILLHRSLDTYVALLAIGKADNTFVPIDPAAPADRVAFIIADAGVEFVVTSSSLSSALPALACTTIEVDTDRAPIELSPSHRRRPVPRVGDDPDPDGADPVAYVMYTSGSSGRPKGVQIAQSSICNFLRVVPQVYDVRPVDRVYQGMTISFDFSIEEIWPTWAVGAALVVGPTDSRRLGAELADFLDDAGVTVLYCVPTLLATIPRDLPRLRSVLVGGEACPAQLVERWSRPGRRMLNTYGPTEATVTATVAELLPRARVTIGRPLPTYTVVLLDDDRAEVAPGEIGEICIGGPGVALGYVGRPDLTADRFVHHRLAPAPGRLYRTGDLGRLTPEGELEYHGRADAEVKIRGHRVDLGEIESVLLEDPAVTEAVVALSADPADAASSGELAAYVVQGAGVEVPRDVLTERLHEQLVQRLPAYMVPVFLDVVSALPTMPSGKVDRTRLPRPARRLALRGGPVVEPEGPVEEQVRTAWAAALGLEPEALSVEANFFSDLGGHSLLAAQVVSRLREVPESAGVALRDLYDHPTVRGMATQLAARSGHRTAPTRPRPRALRHSTRRIAVAGGWQAASIYLLLLVVTLPVVYVYTENDGFVSVQVLAQLLVAILVSYLNVRWVLPILVGRLMVAGIRPGRYKLWGVTYLRIWSLNLLLSISPLPVLSGSPLAAPYLRLLGAKIGTHAQIATSAISLPSMLRIGDRAAVGYGVSLNPWRVEDGWVVVEPITIGSDAFVGAQAVLDPGATVQAEAALGELSVLSDGETVPAGHRYAGSPAEPVDRLSVTVESMLVDEPCRDGWRPGQLAAVAVGAFALEIAAIAMIVPSVALVWWALLAFGVIAGLLATLLAGPVFVLTVCAVVLVGKRVILPSLPLGAHPLRSGLGVRKWLADKLIEFSLMFTNSLYATLYTAPWLRLLGADIGRGAEVSTAAHLDPDLLTLGDDSFVADMASLGAATFVGGRVMFQRTEIGARSFVGNAAVVAAGASMGDGSLVGVCTAPPESGVPPGTSWLGSPAMRLPVRQDSGSFPEELTFRPTRPVVRHRLLIELLRATLPASVLGVSFYLYLWVLSDVTRGRDIAVPALVSPLMTILSGLAVVAFCVAVKRNFIGTYRPRVEPLWSRTVRHSELVTGLYEAAAVPAAVGMLVGTPFLPPLLRAFGAKVGRGTWIGTTYLTEFDLVEIGDDAVIGTEVSLQTHLFEDRVMKMSVVTVEAGATVGTRAVVLYDAVVERDVSLGSLSLVMKGEHLPATTEWRGIPAQAVDRLPSGGQAGTGLLAAAGAAR